MVEPVPQKPTRLYSFNDYNLTQPTLPLPGNQVDAEMDRTNGSVSDIIDFVRQAINDDGKVKASAIDIPGFVGPQGEKGDKGDLGPQGPVGPQGPQGETGPQGIQGVQGVTGAAGQSYTPDAYGVFSDRAQYDAEPKGFSFLELVSGTLYFKQSNTSADWTIGAPFGRGPQGPEGPQGIQGIQGEQGVQGPIGPQGPQGDPGPQGVQGPTGTLVHHVVGTGAPSAALGNNGDLAVNDNGDLYEKATGAWSLKANLTGPQGPQGVKGDKGDQGIQGVKGDQGDPGPTGPIGPPGNMDGSHNLSELTNPATARANLGSDDAANLTKGTLPDGRLPARMQGIHAQIITDWNTPTKTGWYAGNGIANAPVAGTWFLGRMEVYGDDGAGVWAAQTAWDFSNSAAADMKMYRRDQRAGVWGAWYRLRLSETEQAAIINAAISAADVGSLLAAVTFGGIGTIALVNVVAGAVPTPGSNVAGSNLKYANSGGSSASTPLPTGTWRLMGNVVGVAGSTGSTTVAQRIA